MKQHTVWPFWQHGEGLQRYLYFPMENGGQGGIRTLGDVSATPAFQASPFDRSGNSLGLFEVFYKIWLAKLGKFSYF